MCPDLTPPENGAIEFMNNVGDTATYTCDDGYDLSGESTRICLSTGTWSGSEPVCESKINADIHY